jgi:hypothetical protein
VLSILFLAALALVLLVGPAWLLVWELWRGRTLPPFRIVRATQPGRYWLCIAAHVLIWLLWILAGVFLVLALVVVPEISN